MRQTKDLATPPSAAPENAGQKIKRLRVRWLAILMFLTGLAIFAYPWISQAYYHMEFKTEVQDFESTRDELAKAEQDRRVELARAYNSTLNPDLLSDPYSRKEKIAGVAEYARMLEIHEKIAHVEIPKLGEDLPVYAGTSEEVLQKGVGHMEGTSLPVGGSGSHCVLTAHRGLPGIRLFTDLNQLARGDVFYVHNIQGTLAYRVDQILTVEPTDFEPIYVQAGQDYCTLLTCTPYAINSHRLLVRGQRIAYQDAIAEEKLLEKSADRSYQYLFLAAVLVALSLMFALIQTLWTSRSLKKRMRAATKTEQEGGEPE